MSRGRRNENFGSGFDGLSSDDDDMSSIHDDDLLPDYNQPFNVNSQQPSSGRGDQFLNALDGSDIPAFTSHDADSIGSLLDSSNSIASGPGQPLRLASSRNSGSSRTKHSRGKRTQTEKPLSSKQALMKKNKKLTEELSKLKAKRNTRSINACKRFHDAKNGRSTLIQTLFGIAVRVHKQNIDAHFQMLVNTIPLNISTKEYDERTEQARKQANNYTGNAVYFIYTRADGKEHKYRTVSGKDQNAHLYSKTPNEKGFFTVQLEEKHSDDFYSARFTNPNCVRASFNGYTPDKAQQWFTQLNNNQPFDPTKKCQTKKRFTNEVAKSPSVARQRKVRSSHNPVVANSVVPDQVVANPVVSDQVVAHPVVHYTAVGPNVFNGGMHARNRTASPSRVPFIQRVQSPRPSPPTHHHKKQRAQSNQHAPSRRQKSPLKSPRRRQKTSTKSSNGPVATKSHRHSSPRRVSSKKNSSKR